MGNPRQRPSDRSFIENDLSAFDSPSSFFPHQKSASRPGQEAAVSKRIRNMALASLTGLELKVVSFNGLSPTAGPLSRWNFIRSLQGLPPAVGREAAPCPRASPPPDGSAPPSAGVQNREPGHEGLVPGSGSGSFSDRRRDPRSADDRYDCMWHPNLMGTSGLKAAFDQGGVLEPFPDH